MPAARRSGGQPGGQRRYPERSAIGDHMPGVGQQGQRTRTPAGNQLDDRKSKRQRKGKQKGFASGRMRVGMLIGIR